MSTGFIYLLVKLDSIIRMLEMIIIPIYLLLGISIIIVLISYIGQLWARDSEIFYKGKSLWYRGSQSYLT